MASVADLLISIEANVSQASAQINALKGELDGVANPPTPTVGEQLATSLEKARPAGVFLAGLGASILGGFGLAVQGATDFEQEMANVRSVMDPTDVATFGDALSDLALKLGADTTFSAQEAAGAIGELIRAGVPAEAAIDGVARAALDLAAATGIDVADAASIAAAAMNTFRVPASDITSVMDTLAGVANASAAEMTDLRLGLAMVGPVAATAGLSFDDTATALGLFANNGLVGSDAGTSLKTMLLGLIPKTDEAYQVMQDLGIVTEDGANAFFDSTGKMKGLADIAGILQSSTADLTDEQRLMALQTMFGTDAIRSAAIMTREGADGFNTLSGAVEGMSVADMATQRMDTLNGSVEEMRGSLETAAIAIGTALIPAMRTVTDTVRDLVNRFLALPESTQQVIVVIGLIAGVVSTLVGGFVLLAPFLASLPGAFAALGSAAGILGGAIAPIVAPVAAVAAALGLLYLAWTNDWGGIQGIVANVWANVQPILVALADWIGTRVGDAVRTLSGLWTNTLLPAMQTAWAWIVTYVVPVFESLGDLLGAVFGVAMRAAAGLWQNVLVPAFTAISDAAGNLLDDYLRPLWQFLDSTFSPALEWLGENVVTPLATAFGKVGDFLGDVAGFFRDVASALNNLKLPWFLEPGSPSPFETALRGILDVVLALAGAPNPLAWLETLGDWLGGVGEWIFGTGDSGTAPTGPTGGGSITVYGPLVSIGNADADEVVGALVAAFDILWTGADNTEGYQPGGNWS